VAQPAGVERRDNKESVSACLSGGHCLTLKVIGGERFDAGDQQLAVRQR
jgi:hypothetical protein